MTSFAACSKITDEFGFSCGWVTGGAFCKAKECTDSIPNPSAPTCIAYHSTCVFNGIACVVAAACTTYALTSFAACSAMTDGAGNACGWMTGGPYCKAKSCWDAIPNPNAANCAAYLPSCRYG